LPADKTQTIAKKDASNKRNFKQQVDENDDSIIELLDDESMVIREPWAR